MLKTGTMRTGVGGADLKLLKMEAVMTPSPITIGEDVDLATARKLLREHKIRHLPVVHRGKLTGILSERDTRLVALVPDISKISVADVMIRHPLTVTEAIPVLEAVAKMTEKKYGCVIVTGAAGAVTGIFTSDDALRLLLGERNINIPVATNYMLEDGDEEDPCLD